MMKKFSIILFTLFMTSNSYGIFPDFELRNLSPHPVRVTVSQRCPADPTSSEEPINFDLPANPLGGNPSSVEIREFKDRNIRYASVTITVNGVSSLVAPVVDLASSFTVYTRGDVCHKFLESQRDTSEAPDWLFSIAKVTDFKQHVRNVAEEWQKLSDDEKEKKRKDVHFSCCLCDGINYSPRVELPDLYKYCSPKPILNRYARESRFDFMTSDDVPLAVVREAEDLHASVGLLHHEDRTALPPFTMENSSKHPVTLRITRKKPSNPVEFERPYVVKLGSGTSSEPIIRTMSRWLPFHYFVTDGKVTVELNDNVVFDQEVDLRGILRISSTHSVDYTKVNLGG